MSLVPRLARREFGAGLFVIGGAGILEWAEVFGDGGSGVQLVVSIVLLIAGIWIMSRASLSSKR